MKIIIYQQKKKSIFVSVNLFCEWVTIEETETSSSAILMYPVISEAQN